MRRPPRRRATLAALALLAGLIVVVAGTAFDVTRDLDPKGPTCSWVDSRGSGGGLGHEIIDWRVPPARVCRYTTDAFIDGRSERVTRDYEDLDLGFFVVWFVGLMAVVATYGWGRGWWRLNAAGAP